MTRLKIVLALIAPMAFTCSQKKSDTPDPAPAAQSAPETPPAVDTAPATDPTPPVTPIIVNPADEEDEGGPIIVDEDDEEKGSNVVVVNDSQLPGPNGEAPKNPVSVKTKDDLPLCNRANEGLEVFIEKDEKVFKCIKGKFEQKKVDEEEDDDY